MPWDKDTITRLIEVEAQLQGVDPRLAVAVAQQESNLRPDNPGDNGRSRGVFHLQERAALDAGIDPKQRDDPAIGIFGGVRYLKQQLDKSGGHIPQALSRYNRGTPDYRGIGDPDYVYHVMRHYPDHPLGKAPTDQEAYRARLNKTFGAGTAGPADKPGVLTRAVNALSPASAEAATTQPQGRSRLEEIEAELARRDGQAAPQTPPAAPSPPTATSTPEQDAAYRASRGQKEPPPASQPAPPPPTQPGASQGPPAPSPDPSPTPGMRFQALPSITQLEPADRMQKTKLFESLTPAMQEEFLRSEEPAAGGLAMGGGPVAQSQPVTDPAALLAGGRGTARPSAPAPAAQAPGPDTRPWWQRQLMPRVETAGPTGAPPNLDAELQAQLAPAQQGMTGVLLGGAAGAAGAALGRGAASLLGRGASLLPVIGAAAGSYGGRQANVALGNEQPGTVGDVLSAAIPLAGRAVGAIAPAIVRRLPGSAGAQHEMMAERIRAQPAAQAPATPAATLYRAVTQQGNPAIPAQQLRQTAQDLLTAEMRHGASLRNPTIVGVTRDIDALAAQYPQGIPMDRLYETMQRVGEMVGAAKRTGGTETRALNRLYAGFHEAIENAAQTNIPGAETLRQAIAASRQEHAVRRLGRIVGQGRGIEEQTATGYTFVKGKKMLNEFDRLVVDDDVFRGSFTPEQIQEMRGLFQEASRLPALPTPSGTPRGSGAAATRAALGSIVGGPVGAALAVSGHEIIAQAMMTAPGRAMLRAALEGRGGLTPQALAVLNTALREQLPAEKP